MAKLVADLELLLGLARVLPGDAEVNCKGGENDIFFDVIGVE